MAADVLCDRVDDAAAVVRWLVGGRFVAGLRLDGVRWPAVAVLVAVVDGAAEVRTWADAAGENDVDDAVDDAVDGALPVPAPHPASTRAGTRAPTITRPTPTTTSRSVEVRRVDQRE